MDADGQTWQKSGSSFSPGRLDYIVVSSRTLEPTFSIVIDTLDLPELALRGMDLVRTDTRRASDHLPVIVDLAADHTNQVTMSTF